MSGKTISPEDEKYLQSLMTGGIQNDPEPEPRPESSGNSKKPERKTTYADTYIFQTHPHRRKAVYIDSELHKIVCQIVGVAGERISTGSFVDNILREHLLRHEKDVKSFGQKIYSKIL